MSDEVSVELFTGDRQELLWSFREAEDSETSLRSYLDQGSVWVARTGGGEVVAHLQAVARGDEWEVLNTAVAPDRRGQGIGLMLMSRALDEARRAGARRLVVATGAADVGNLRFYQRCGLRMERVVPDAFTPETGYPDPIVIDGILLRDQVWFGIDL